MMKISNRIWLTFLFCCFLADITQARIGGGGGSSGRSSFGSRGSRGFSPRPASPTSPSAPSRSFPGNPAGNTSGWNQNRPGIFGGGQSSFMRGLVGGIAGGFLGSMLFRGLGFAGPTGGFGGGGGFGFLELLLIGGLIYFLFRWFRKQQMQTATGMGSSSDIPSSHATAYSSAGATSSSSSYDTQTGKVLQFEPPAAPHHEFFPSSEVESTQVLQRYAPQFDLTQFKQNRIDDFFKIQAAFGKRDLTSIQAQLTEEMHRQLQAEVDSLRQKKHINRLENIAVRETLLIDAWQEYGREYATIQIKANVIDYTCDETTGQVVFGNQTEPVKFEDLWTFVRDLNQQPSASAQWKLSAIETNS